MYEYIEGALREKNPAGCVIETGGIGYFIQISLHTYSQIEQLAQVRLFLHQVVREDAHLLFGFFSRSEREMFRMLIGVTGVGANTARMMLSYLSPDDLRQHIIQGNVAPLQAVKGIGAKTAQRIIMELQDKMGKEKGVGGELFPMQSNRLKEEALSALVILGFNKNEADKVISRILVAESQLSLEELIKKALKQF
jgi:holliday junction DNA helicase RuvA